MRSRIGLTIEGRPGHAQAAQRGRVPGGIGVERQDHVGGEALQQPELLFRQGRPHRGDHVGEAGLMQGNDVHVAFDQDNLLSRPNSLAGFIQAVEKCSLVEENCLG